MKTRLAKISLITFVIFQFIYIYYSYSIFEMRIQVMGFIMTYRFDIAYILLAIITYLLIEIKARFIRPFAIVVFLMLPLYQVVMTVAIGLIATDDMSDLNIQVMVVSFLQYAVLFIGVPYLHTLKSMDKVSSI